jgi:glutathione S-transferase
MAVILYDFEPSPACYAARLLLAMLGVRHEIVPVDVEPGREHLSPWFLGISGDGTLPVLEIEGARAIGRDAVLRELARRYDAAGTWAGSADTGTWLEFAADLAASSGVARWSIATGEAADVPQLQQAAHRLFRRLDAHLWFGEREHRSWLLPGEAPSIADIAVFTEAILSEEGGVSRQDYPALRRWTDRVRRIPGFVVMSGVFPAGPAFDRAEPNLG